MTMLSDLRTDREIFEYVKKHLLSQKERSVYEGEDETYYGSCMYLSSSGKKCAVGCLIAPEYYAYIMENKTIYSDSVMERIEASLTGMEVTAFTLAMLDVLQQAHDKVDPDDWNDLLNHDIFDIAFNVDGSFIADIEKAILAVFHEFRRA